MQSLIRYIACGLLLVGGSQNTGGADCGTTDGTYGDLCTSCGVDVGGVYFHCDEPHIYVFCNWTPDQNFICAEVYSNQCGGTRTNYASDEDCQMQANPTGTQTCATVYGWAANNFAHPCGPL